MTGIENPPGFVLRTEAQKAASENGYRLERGLDGGGFTTFRRQRRDLFG
jgi:hypothetical protein